MLAKEPAALTAEDDALTVGYAMAAFPVHLSTRSGNDATIEAAGITDMQLAEMFMPTNFTQTVATTTDDRNLVLRPLLLELLRAPEKLPDFALPGVLMAAQGIFGRPAGASKLLEQGAIDVCMDVLRKISPAEMVSTAGFSRRPNGMAMFCIKALVENAQAAGIDLTPKLLSCGFVDTVVSALSAVEQIGADNVHGSVVTFMVWCMVNLDGEALGQIETKLRAIPSALHYIVENSVSHMANFGVSGSTLANILAANLWGRDEEATFGFAQKDIDGFMICEIELLRCELWGYTQALGSNHCRGMLNLCISDLAKQMLLSHPGFISHLIDGLLLDPEHPRLRNEASRLASRADDLTCKYFDTVKSAVQRDFAECIMQISLYPPGCAALKANPDVIKALDNTVDNAWSEEAKICARGALKQLCPERNVVIEINLEALHIMMSCEFIAYLLLLG